MALNRIQIPSPFYSSRAGATVTTIVLHTAEGSTSYQNLGAWFQNPSAQVSSHVGVDDTENTVGEYVQRSGKAWTQANANPWCVSAELCGFADWDSATWNTHPNMLANCAAWIAEEAAHFDIPIVALNAEQAQNPDVRGVCQHADLGSLGGGHWDCGSGFPMSAVLALAQGVTPPEPAPAPVPPSSSAPPWPGRYLSYPPEMQGDDVRTWQAQMDRRGWNITVDGWYGGQSREVCFTFQAEKGLDSDGVVGPETWAAAWTAPVT